MASNERLVGYALYFYTYSTWEGRALYVEDLFVRMEYRSERHQSSLVFSLYADDYTIQCQWLGGRVCMASMEYGTGAHCSDVEPYIVFVCSSDASGH